MGTIINMDTIYIYNNQKYLPDIPCSLYISRNFLKILQKYISWKNIS